MNICVGVLFLMKFGGDTTQSDRIFFIVNEAASRMVVAALIASIFCLYVKLMIVRFLFRIMSIIDNWLVT